LSKKLKLSSKIILLLMKLLQKKEIAECSIGIGNGLRTNCSSELNKRRKLWAMIKSYAQDHADA
jgi:hypothetical protein